MKIEYNRFTGKYEEVFDLHSKEVQELLSDIELVTEIKKKVAEKPEHDFLNKANFFEDFLHMFFGSDDVRPYDQEYYSSYQNDETFLIVGEDGKQCENEQVYKDLEPRAIKYGYSLESDNKFYPLEGEK